MNRWKHVDFEVADWGELSAGPAAWMSYASFVLSLEPVGYWRSIQGQSVLDWSGNGHHGTVIGNVAAAPGAIHRDADAAMVFDGASRVEIPDHADLDFTGDLTLLAWINTTQSAGAFPRLINKDTGADHGYQLILASNSGYIARLEPRCTNLHFHGVNAAGAVVNDGQWHLVVATVDAGRPTIYVDGQFVAQVGEMDAPGRTNSVPLTLGSAPEGGEYIGLLDEAAVWGRALNAQEVRHLYERGIGRFNLSI
ncbi:MAG TPA: LamG domain-containing protein [Phycisphaeraceae bacterium]